MSLLCRDNEVVEVGMNDDGAESTELGNQLHEQLPHETVEGAAQRRLIQQTLRRTQPPTGEGRSYMKGSSQVIFNKKKIDYYNVFDVLQVK